MASVIRRVWGEGRERLEVFIIALERVDFGFVRGSEAQQRTFNSEKFSRPTRVCSQAARQRILDAATSGQLLTTSALPKIGSGIEADLSLAEERSAASAGCGGGLPTRHAGGSGRPFGHLSAPPMSFLLEGEGEKTFILWIRGIPRTVEQAKRGNGPMCPRYCTQVHNLTQGTWDSALL